MNNIYENFDFEKLKKAGHITKLAREYGMGLVKKGASILDITKKIEKKIIELGGGIAFPVNISMNETAAHDTARVNDDRILNDELIKLDIGVHVDGWIGDSACTIDLSGKNTDLVNASKDALKAAIATIKEGVTLGQIGKAIEDTIVAKGFAPVRNLAGHQIGQYMIHTGTSIPNYDTKDDTKIIPGMIFAIEPFATTGSGLIEEKGKAEIFSIGRFKPTRLQMVREVLTHINKTYSTMPFSSQMLTDKFSENKIKLALNTLKINNTLKSYAPLVEKTGGLVSQAEHTLYVDEDWKVHVLTE